MKNFSRYAIFTGLWLVLLVPFLVGDGQPLFHISFLPSVPNMFFPYITLKNFTFRIIIEIIFALWVYLAYVDENTGRSPGSPKPSEFSFLSCLLRTYLRSIR